MKKSGAGIIESQEAWERRFAASGALGRAAMSARSGDARGLAAALMAGGRAGELATMAASAWAELWGFTGSWSRSGDRLECARLLAKAGADLNQRREWDGVSALGVSCLRCAAPETRLLIELGADPEARDRSGAAPLTLAMKARLATSGSSFDRIQIARALREAGASLDAQDLEGDSALAWAARGRHWGVAEWLLESGADWRSRSRSGKTALIWCQEGGQGSALEARLLALTEGEGLESALTAARKGEGRSL